MMKHLIFILSVFFSQITITMAASFDCSKASTLVENAICSDNELSALDESLLTAYRNALSNAHSANEVKASQRRWLKQRNACKDKTCLNNAYTQRIAELNNVSNAPTTAPSKTALPKKVGQCIDLTIIDKVARLEGAVAGDSGGEIFVRLSEELGVYIQNISYLPESENVDKYMYQSADFAKGDKVKVCLKALPRNCPKGDDRGKVYSITNYKNQKSFTGVDSWHLCGGA